MTVPRLGSQLLRLLSEAPRPTDKLCVAISGAARPHVARAIERMADEGLIALKWGRWQLTRAGRRAVPAPELQVAVRPYVPPVAPPRRPGSDHSHIPSLAGGKLIRRIT